MAEAVQTMPRRLLGGELKRLRQQAGLSAEEAGAAIGKDQSRVSKLEDGRSTLTADELATLLDLFSATKADRKKLLAMGVEARKREPKRRAYVDTLPGSYRRISNMEVQASHIFTYERGIFPALLQHESYAEAVVAACDDIWWESSFQGRVDRVSFRLDRQRRVFRASPAKELEFIVTDDALRAEFGGRRVLHRQLAHVLLLLDEHPGISVLVLPASAPDNPAPNSGFTLFQFPNSAAPVGLMSVVYGPSPYLDDSGDTSALTRVFKHLRDLAFDKEESRILIERSLPRR